MKTKQQSERPAARPVGASTLRLLPAWSRSGSLRVTIVVACLGVRPARADPPRELGPVEVIDYGDDGELHPRVRAYTPRPKPKPTEPPPTIVAPPVVPPPPRQDSAVQPNRAAPPPTIAPLAGSQPQLEKRDVAASPAASLPAAASHSAATGSQAGARMRGAVVPSTRPIPSVGAVPDTSHAVPITLAVAGGVLLLAGAGVYSWAHSDQVAIEAALTRQQGLVVGLSRDEALPRIASVNNRIGAAIALGAAGAIALGVGIGKLASSAGSPVVLGPGPGQVGLAVVGEF